MLSGQTGNIVASVTGVPFVPYFAPAATGTIIPVSPAASSFGIATAPTNAATPGSGQTLRRAATIASPLALAGCNTSDWVWVAFGGLGLLFLAAAPRLMKAMVTSGEKKMDESQLDRARNALKTNPYDTSAATTLDDFIRRTANDIGRCETEAGVMPMAYAPQPWMSALSNASARNLRAIAAREKVKLAYALSLRQLIAAPEEGMVIEKFRNTLNSSRLGDVLDRAVRLARFIDTKEGFEGVRNDCMSALKTSDAVDVGTALLEWIKLGRPLLVKMLASAGPDDVLGPIWLAWLRIYVARTRNRRSWD